MSGKLLVRGSYAEQEAPADTAVELLAELGSMAAWLDPNEVVVEPRGDFVAALTAARGSRHSPSGNLARRPGVAHPVLY